MNGIIIFAGIMVLLVMAALFGFHNAASKPRCEYFDTNSPDYVWCIKGCNQ
jgi:hypothetical protein